MTAPVTIRPVTPADRPEWAALWTSYLEFYETSVRDAVYDATFSRLCAPDHPDQNGLLAVSGGKPVGLVHYIYHPHNWRLEKVCYLQDLYVDPSMRGHGVGRKLIEAVYAAADADGCPSVYWLTQDFNAEARKLYDRIGVLTPFIKYARP
ncbi:GNAT family N-acetyltransferase [Roseovarius salis]|uniref:GNAT family N-acetyltransferase n=1 Tax=Roseovarius salis TaxID=3376063 RepID=UPI0037C85948